MLIRFLMLLLGFCGALVVVPAHAADAGAAKEYRLAVFPYLPPREIEKLYSVVATDFSKIIGKPVKFKTSTSFANFVEAIQSEQYELAFVQPFIYVDLADNYGYQAIASPDILLRGVVVVPHDSRIRGWEDLRGKRLALAPKSAAVTRLLKNEIAKQGLVVGKDIHIKYHRSHVSCMQQLKIKKADACGTARPPAEFFQKKMKMKLREVAVSDPIPSSLFVASANVPKGEALLLRKRLLEWSNTPEGKDLIKQLKLNSFRAVNDLDYDVVRTFNAQ